MDDAKWYVRIRGKVTGPFDVRQLEVLRKRGQLSRFHEVSTDRQIWVAASSIAAVFQEVAAAEEPSADADVDEYAVQAQSSTPGTAVSPTEKPWFYARGDSKMGPVSFETLQRLALSGGLQRRDLVWQDGMPEWIPAEQAAVAFPHTVASGTLGGAGMGGSAYYPSAETTMLPRTSGLAVASLVLGILWLCGVGSLLAVIFAAAALSQISKSGGRLLGRGMALAGLILGIVGLALLVLGYALNVIALLSGTHPFR